MRLFALPLAIFMMSAGLASAQGFFSLGSNNDGGDWDAVGRLEIAGKTFCTGALIAPDLVLTAAHCLYDSATGARVPVEDVQFLAGWRNGRAAAYRHVRRAIAHPDYDYAAPADSRRVRNDVALLELQHPIRNTTITPFETDKELSDGDRIGVVSYAKDGDDAPALQERCEVLSRQEEIVVMSCSVDFGSSGSPVFSFESGEPRIVSVVSAKAEAEGDPVSLGVMLEGPMQLLRRELHADTEAAPMPGMKTVTTANRAGSDAKFVRP